MFKNLCIFLLPLVLIACGPEDNNSKILQLGASAAAAGNYSEALKDFEVVSSNGGKEERRDAQYNIGLLYLKGNGVEQSQSKAVAYFSKSATLGFGPACRMLAVYYASSGVDLPNWPKALLNMGSAEMLGTKIPSELKKTILGHSPSSIVKSGPLKVTYKANTNSKLVGTAKQSEKIYAIDTIEKNWKIVYLDRAPQGFIGYVKRPPATDAPSGN